MLENKGSLALFVHEPQRIPYFNRLLQRERNIKYVIAHKGLRQKLLLNPATIYLDVGTWNNKLVLSCIKFLKGKASLLLFQRFILLMYRKVYRELSRIDGFITTSDRSLGDLAIIYIAKDNGKPVYVLPGALPASRNSILSYKRTYFYNGKVEYYPKYLRDFLSEIGVLSTDPFTIGYGYCDQIYLDSRYRYISLNDLPERKLQFMGDGELKEVWALRRNLVDYQSTNSILLSLPQWYEHGLCSLAAQKAHYIELIEGLRAVIAQNRLFISFHPKANKDDYMDILTRFNLTETVSLIEGLANSKILISTYSSIIPLAWDADLETLVWIPFDFSHDLSWIPDEKIFESTQILVQKVSMMLND